MTEPQGFVYLLRNTVNGKGYIGQTRSKRAERRWARHILEADKAAPSHPLYRAIKKHGVEQFTAEVIWQGDATQLNKMETHFISELATFCDGGWGYNLTTGGGAAVKVARQTRCRMREAQKAYWAGLSDDGRAQLAARRVAALKSPTAMQERAKSWADNSAAIAASMARGARKRFQCPIQCASMSAVGKQAWTAERRLNTLAKITVGLNKPESLAKMAKSQRAAWKDPIYREKQLRTRGTTEHRRKQSEMMTAICARPGHRALLSRRQKEVLAAKSPEELAARGKKIWATRRANAARKAQA